MSGTAYELTRCLACAGADVREVASSEDIRSEIEALWEYHTKRLRDDTPPAHLLDRVAFSQRTPLRVVQCTECGFVYRNPIERPVELEEIYAVEAPTQAVMQALHETQRSAYAAQARRLTDVAGRSGTGIEVGSYVGAFLAAARDAGWQMTGVDVNACTNAFTRGLGFEVHDGTIESFDDDRRADAIVIWNCIDQLADPASAIRAARAHLVAGGLLALRAPNGACYAAVRPLLGGPFGALARGWLAQNNLLGFPYRYGFTIHSMTLLLERLGFEVVQSIGDVLVPIADEWTHRWAALEEKLVKSAGRAAVRLSPDDRPLAPWIEIYARAV